MSTASYQDVERLFPGIPDHAVVQLLTLKASIGELESAALLLADQDEGLIDARREAGAKLTSILHVLTSAELTPEADRD